MKKLSLWFMTVMLAILVCGLAIYFQPRSIASAPIAAHQQTQLTAAEPTLPLSTPTPEPWRFPQRSQIGDVVIGGMTEQEARTALNTAYAPMTVPITLVVSDYTRLVKSNELGLNVPIELALAEARDLSDKQIPVRLALAPSYDQKKALALLVEINDQITISPTLGYDAAAHTFVMTDGIALDTSAALQVISTTLTSQSNDYRLELPTRLITAELQATPDQVVAAIQAREKKWGGIIGVSVYNRTMQEQYDYHGDVVFSGMSVMKIPILLQAYISRETFTKQQQTAIRLMIDVSDNKASNELLAMIGDGDSLAGVEMMNTTLQTVLGTEHTILAAPYESIEYLAKIGIDIPVRGKEGAEPYTDADPYVRSTPNEMTKVVQAIVECADGKGSLLTIKDSKLTPARCQEMLDILTENEDINKIVAGVPETAYVAHKSGWIDDARADSGYVRLANGTEYIISMWIWDVDYIETEVSDPLLADLSRIVYTAQYPIRR